MNKLLLCTGLFLWMFITGCNEAQLTTLQRKQLESRDLQGVYDNAYKATLQVFQDYGYAIKNTDYNSGVIHGETGIKQDFWGMMRWQEATATLEQFGPDIVKQRLSILKKIKSSSQYGTHEKSEVVEDSELFMKMYEDIKKKSLFVRTLTNKISTN